MAAGRATLCCGIIWFGMGLGIMRSRSVLGIVRLSGRLLIGKLVSGSVDRGLEIGRAGLVLVFVHLMHLVSLWRRGLVMLRYGIFSFGGWSQASCGTGMF